MRRTLSLCRSVAITGDRRPSVLLSRLLPVNKVGHRAHPCAASIRTSDRRGRPRFVVIATVAPEQSCHSPCRACVPSPQRNHLAFLFTGVSYSRTSRQRQPFLQYFRRPRQSSTQRSTTSSPLPCERISHHGGARSRVTTTSLSLKSRTLLVLSFVNLHRGSRRPTWRALFCELLQLL